MIRMIIEMVGNRSFTIATGNGKRSRLRRLKNGVPQRSVLAPLLFNIYISDLPNTVSRKYGYADDLAIMHADGNWKAVGGGAEQRHGNRKWKPSNLKAKAQHYKNGVGNLPPQQQGSQTWAESHPQQRNPALLFRTQLPPSNSGQVAHVPPTPRVISQKANITRRTLEVAQWLWLGCWSNNVLLLKPP